MTVQNGVAKIVHPLACKWAEDQQIGTPGIFALFPLRYLREPCLFITFKIRNHVAE
jgi:hypothetical protein